MKTEIKYGIYGFLLVVIPSVFQLMYPYIGISVISKVILEEARKESIFVVVQSYIKNLILLSVFGFLLGFVYGKISRKMQKTFIKIIAVLTSLYLGYFVFWTALVLTEVK